MRQLTKGHHPFAIFSKPKSHHADDFVCFTHSAHTMKSRLGVRVIIGRIAAWLPSSVKQTRTMHCPDMSHVQYYASAMLA
ncbi:hypothetical protein BAUCODRAFT_127126 [Baudoinia panamericana UAMH 10762]|uniref:Uncharacterized protein n=1 Tax=Baudoinia panamericana (strain UAMH 10762) TaxID=717646 RepID=M2LBI0_BAUPA|nr:uncharacterized protein BAUCODRAFT_127126 [Baudoinia panamericana UAMH 10762]EMC91212.1 hypothetical protein BAUCODRAFT_127126 [Baudoinia panamericana UAMH 10762]